MEYRLILIIRTGLFAILGFWLMHAQGQRARGSWQDYLSFTNATKTAVGDQKIYCVTDGGLFYYDLADNSVNKLTAQNGLSDFGIKTIAWHESKKILIVAYQNSNIDLISESGVINLSDIKRKQITGNKAINQIYITGNSAYLACGFGIVVINLDRMEIQDTYYIGENGKSLNINDIEIFSGFIYAASDEGIYYADQNDPNLLDYNNWLRVENIPRNSGKFSHLAVFSGSLIANYTPDEYNQDEMYRLEQNNWIRYLPAIQYTGELNVQGTTMMVTGRAEVYIVNSGHQITGIINSYQLNDKTVNPIFARSTTATADGSIWIADYSMGMIKISGNTFESIYPGGPPDNHIFSLYGNNGDIWITPGGRTDAWSNTWQQPRFQLLRNSTWTSFSKSEFPELDGFFDMVAVVADPADPGHIYVASWGGGLLEFRGNSLINRYTNRNSPLESALPTQPDAPFVRIGGLDFDSQGNLWLTNSEVAKNLVKLSPSGEWETIALPEVAGNRNIGQLTVTENDDKWIIIPRGHDVYVVDKNGTRKKHLPVISYFNNGTNEIFNRMNDVYSIAEDHNGDIWIGTSKGIAVFNSPERIWDAQTFYASQPSLDLNDGIYHPLLETETVTAIAIDGANRKWLGTKNSGVYLISESGEKELNHFTRENSPLLSNTITSIALNNQTGEIFFGTDAGLISYWGDAITGNDQFADVYAYPNPVRENYQGPVTITGLMEDTDIKITDISGNLVFHTTSLGGKALWDGRNLNGNRVKTGVYLIFCNDKTGEETHVTKLLFIH